MEDIGRPQMLLVLKMTILCITEVCKFEANKLSKSTQEQ